MKYFNQELPCRPHALWDTAKRSGRTTAGQDRPRVALCMHGMDHRHVKKDILYVEDLKHDFYCYQKNFIVIHITSIFLRSKWLPDLWRSPVGVLKITTTYYGEGTDPVVIKITSPNI